MPQTSDLLSRKETVDLVLLPLGMDWTRLRESPELASVPLLGVAKKASELALAEVFAQGGDDLLALEDRDDCVAKLRAIPSRQEQGEVGPRSALIWSGEASWRSGLARRLRGAGMRVEFAASGAEAREKAAQRPGVLIADGRPGAREVAPALEGLGGLPVLVAVAPGALGEAEAVLGEGVGVHEAIGFDDALLFLVNEAMAGNIRERRRSPRLLFGASVWLRVAGAERDVMGYSYTVSEGGVFVRSVAPLLVGTEAWLELCPPRSARRVRLAGTAVWNRGFGPRSQAVSPPGTGFRIDGGMPGDQERFAAGCRELTQGSPVRSRG